MEIEKKKESSGSPVFSFFFQGHHACGTRKEKNKFHWKIRVLYGVEQGAKIDHSTQQQQQRHGSYNKNPRRLLLLRLAHVFSHSTAKTHSSRLSRRPKVQTFFFFKWQIYEIGKLSLFIDFTPKNFLIFLEKEKLYNLSIKLYIICLVFKIMKVWEKPVCIFWKECRLSWVGCSNLENIT
jgi:hypothetical protein